MKVYCLFFPSLSFRPNRGLLVYTVAMTKPSDYGVEPCVEDHGLQIKDQSDINAAEETHHGHAGIDHLQASPIETAYRSSSER